jgi:hypothetical protein
MRVRSREGCRTAPKPDGTTLGLAHGEACGVRQPSAAFGFRRTDGLCQWSWEFARDLTVAATLRSMRAERARMIRSADRRRIYLDMLPASRLRISGLAIGSRIFSCPAFPGSNCLRACFENGRDTRPRVSDKRIPVEIRPREAARPYHAGLSKQALSSAQAALASVGN